MQNMDLIGMAMPSADARGPVDLLLVFAMWAVMMIAIDGEYR
jgi:predicted metal-binding membrane protein